VQFEELGNLIHFSFQRDFDDSVT